MLVLSLDTILSEFFVKCSIFRYNENMNKKNRIGLLVLGVLVLILIFFIPHIRRQIRQDEGQIVPKVTVTDHVKAVPNDNIKALLASQPKTTIIILNVRNAALNQKFDQFMNQNQNLGLTQPIYIFQELYHDKFLGTLNLESSAINIVQFSGEQAQSIEQLTLSSKFDQNLVKHLQDLSKS